MLTRRSLLAVTAVMPLSACAEADGYEAAVAATWRFARPAPGFPAAALIHAATLAASSHNTQPWRFSTLGTQVRIRPDITRRTPIVDPDDHHLYVSLGCATETLLRAGLGYGWAGELRPLDPREGVLVDFVPGPVAAGAMFQAITHRASTRADYDGRAVKTEDLRALASAVGADTDLDLITDSKRLNEATDFIVRGNTAQVHDPAFRRELKAWIRFSEPEALARRDGLFAAASGSPTFPRVIGERLFDVAFTEDGETKKLVRQMRSSAGLAVFSSPSDNAAGWIEAGRAYTRFALLATARGLKFAFLNQPVENVAARAEFARWLGGPGRRPDLVVRFGYGPDMPRSLRRPVDEVTAA